MNVEHFENLVIGSGVGGKLLGWTLAKRGQKTVVVERSMVGGSCPNVACLPSKNVIYSAKALSLVDPKRGLGITTGQLEVDMPAVARRKRKMVDDLVAIHLENFRASGAELVMGEARFVQPKTVEVTLNGGGSRLLFGDRVFLGLGTRAGIPPVPGLAAAGPLTHVEALNLERVPDHLVVVGGGYVGLEFAQAFRRFGGRVTIIQRAKQLLEREDADIAQAVEELMRDERIEVLLLAEMLDVAGRSGDGVKIRLRRVARKEPWKLPIFCWRPAGCPTPIESMQQRPVSSSTRAGTSESMSDSRPRPWMFGPWATVPEVLSSRTSAKMIFALC